MGTGVFIAVVIIGAFAAFIMWARSEDGQTTLKKSSGPNHSFKKRQRMARRRTPTTGARRTRSTKPSSR